MITLRTWYIFFTAVSLWAAVPLNAALQETLSPQTILPGTRAELLLQLDIADLSGFDPSNENQIPELDEATFNQLKGVLLLDRSFERTPTQFVWKYYFTAYLPGSYRISPIEIKLGAQTFSTTAKELIVHSNRPETDDELRPEFGEETLTPSSSFYLLWILPVIFLLAALGFFLYRKIQKRHVVTPDSSDLFESPEAFLKRSLEALLKSPFKDQKEYAEAITQVLRAYLSKRYLFPIESCTLRELFQRVNRTEPALQNLEGLKTLLKLAEDSLYNPQTKTQWDLGKSVTTIQANWLTPNKTKGEAP